jgi:hypothetical protein
MPTHAPAAAGLLVVAVACSEDVCGGDGPDVPPLSVAATAGEGEGAANAG